MLFCHGFPGLWSSWRHQLPAIANAGFTAVAVDMRGYGRSDRPSDPALYVNQTIVGDLVAILDALDAEDAVLVGHDFGAQSVWAAALHAPTRVKAVVSLSVPYGLGFSKAEAASSDGSGQKSKRGPKPTETFAKIAKKHFLHLHYFQQVGVAERELGRNARTFLRRIHWALSAAGSLLDFRNFPSEGTGYLDVLAEPTKPLPWHWFNEDALDYLVEEALSAGEAKAFIGGLCSYRAMDLNWLHDPEYGRAQIAQPALFVYGAEDPVLQMVSPKSLDTMPDRVPQLRGVVRIEGAGHFVQLEQPEAVNDALCAFLASLRPASA